MEKMCSRRLVLRSASAAFTVFILWLSSVPMPPAAGGAAGYANGWLAHLAIYFAYSVLLYFAFHPSQLGSRPAKKPATVSMALSAALGLATELIQLSVPGRSADAADLAFDVAGAALGLITISLLKRNTKRA